MTDSWTMTETPEVECTRIGCDKPALPGSLYCAEHQPASRPAPRATPPPRRGRGRAVRGVDEAAPVQQPTYPIETPEQLARRLQKLAPRKRKRRRK